MMSKRYANDYNEKNNINSKKKERSKQFVILRGEIKMLKATKQKVRITSY